MCLEQKVQEHGGGQVGVDRVQVMRSPNHYGKAPGNNPLNDGDQGQTDPQDTRLDATWATPQVAALHEEI